MNRINSLTMQALTFASVLILFLSACAEEPLGGNDQKEGGHTVTLRIAASVAPIPETKATATPARSGSEAEAAGFYVERVSSDAQEAGFNYEIETTRPDSIVITLATKAPATLKNVYALLFTSTGAFNGYANIGTLAAGTATDITFEGVKTVTEANCQLVIVANDDAAETSYESSAGTGNFSSFSGNYAAFQALTITNKIKRDEDVPYAGSATVNLSLSETGATIPVDIYRTMAKITLNNTEFNIKNGPARSSITLYNAGIPRFAPATKNTYDGKGSTETSTFVATTEGGNDNSITWYVGENIRPAGKNINSAADRNRVKAPENACYIRIASDTLQTEANPSPAIGEEYSTAGTKALTYDFYLGKSTVVSDFNLRRNTNYTITTAIGGTLAGQEELALNDGRVIETTSEGVFGGLVIGRFGGPSGFTNGSPSNIVGTYSKFLILEPNTSRTTAADNVSKQWGIAKEIQYQVAVRRCWDWNYIYGITDDETCGGMSTASGYLYDYCHQLTLGGVETGTWYVPTSAQLIAIWTMLSGIKEKYPRYAGFNSTYWSSTQNVNELSWYVDANGGLLVDVNSKNFRVRCVRDLE